MALASLRVDVYLTPGDRVAALRKDVLLGLTSDPKELPAKWFYNDRGSALFEEITGLLEYYLTSRERSILLADGTEIAGLTGAETLIELGSGSADKTGILLRALAEAGSLRRYVPFDVSEQALRDSAARIAVGVRNRPRHCLLLPIRTHTAQTRPFEPNMVQTATP